MRLFLAFLLIALAAPLAAFAADGPSPGAVAACQAEAKSLGTQAFVAKYGPSEPFGHCYAAHAGDAAPSEPPATTPSSDDPATAACKAESLRLGSDAFKAKYGATEAFANCLHAQTAPVDPPKPPKPNQGDGGAASVANAFCRLEAKSLGTKAFVAKYGGKEAMGNCMKAALAKAKSVVASCKASSGSNKDAFRACVLAAVDAAAPKR